MAHKILIVDDEKDIRFLIRGILEDEGFDVVEASSSQETYDYMSHHSCDLVILDIWLHGSDHDGLQILEKIQDMNSILPVIMISGHGTIETAVDAIKKGAYDFIEKPFKTDRLILMIRRALENAELRQEYERLKLESDFHSELTGTSQAIQKLRNILLKTAETSNNRIILKGEVGSGKTLAARFIHRHSEQSNKPFYKVNCCDLSEENFEKNLFGIQNLQVLNGIAGGSQLQNATLYLDGIDGLSLPLQSQFLNFMKDHDIVKTMRIIAGTTQDLETQIANKKFNRDLYNKLNIHQITIPPLRKRQEDLPDLIEYLYRILNHETLSSKELFTKEALDVMEKYHWPGNVKQLKNILEWIVIKNKGHNDPPYGLEDLPRDFSDKNHHELSEQQGEIFDFSHLTLKAAREQFEIMYLQSQVRNCNGNISKTADLIGMERSALHRKLKSLNICVDAKQENHNEEFVDFSKEKQRA